MTQPQRLGRPRLLDLFCGDGWLRSTSYGLAHYYFEDGHSACHMWTATVRDKPELSAPRCPACSEVVGFRGYGQR